MTRKEKLNIIFSQFDKSAKQFCEDTNGLFCEISSIYKDEENKQDLQYRFAKIYYSSFAIKFTYTSHSIMNAINSILGCSVYFDKNEDSIEIPLPLATDYCDMDFAIPMYIPFITNDKGMAQAFDCIGSVLHKSLDKFAKISCNPEAKAAVLNAFTNEIRYIFNLDSSSAVNPNAVDAITCFFTLRFSSEAFMSYIKGNNAKAVKQLKKIKNLTSYEKRLVNLWMSEDQDILPDLSAVIINLEEHQGKGIHKANFREFSAVFLSWLLLAPVIGAVYVGIYFLLVCIEGRKSVYLMGPAYNFPYCIFFGFLTAIIVSYFTRFKFYKWLHKKSYEKYCEMDYIQNGGGADKTMKRFLVFLTVVGIVGCVFLSKWNLNFLSDGFVDNSRFLSLKGEYYAYSEIEKVYYKPDRVNGFNETIDFPSYVLVLKNGVEIDFYELGEISDYENELLEYLRDKGVEIEGSNSK